VVALLAFVTLLLQNCLHHFLSLWHTRPFHLTSWYTKP
jgi:hypothetical protein